MKSKNPRLRFETKILDTTEMHPVKMNKRKKLKIIKGSTFPDTEFFKIICVILRVCDLSIENIIMFIASMRKIASP